MEYTTMHQHGWMSKVYPPLPLQLRSYRLSQIIPSLEGAPQASFSEKKQTFGFPLHGFQLIIVCLKQTTSCLHYLLGGYLPTLGLLVTYFVRSVFSGHSLLRS
jgi:hypothetical protein